ncbi:MAG TPA: carboxylesterase family protein [Steroidobacteraceae bacterium]|nr:carboxylesterase family protein [Steroidobacteraceae bacterium]
MTNRYIRAAFAAALVLASGAALAQVTTARVTGGQVEGIAANGVVSFKGIPFAAPPVADLRWRAPQPLVPWSGTKKADTFGPSCMQDANFAVLFGAPKTMGEDCLYLNVWTPAKSAGEKLPVMVWIYGGGFVGGMTSVPTYDGTKFAQKGVVLVSVAYRLGAFGFLAHPQLSREGHKSSGNYGILDQIAGLKWVKANIAKFGGDPARVTIFGESAGGLAVGMLAQSPLAKGLFAGVISESGGNFGPPKVTDSEGGVNAPPLKIAEITGQKFLARLGANDIKAARALDAAVIQKALGPGLQGAFWPVYDDVVLPSDPYALYKSGRYNDTPILIGTNSDEGALFVTSTVKSEQFEGMIRGGYGAQADMILAANPHSTDAEATQSARDIFRDTAFAWPTWTWATLQSQTGKGKVFVYVFDVRNARSPHGASHGAEIAYVFENFAGPGITGIAAPTPEDLAISDLISNYWVNFAKHADPNGAGLPAWPAYTKTSHEVMHLAIPTSSPEAVPNMTQLKALDVYYAARREELKRKKAN